MDSADNRNLTMNTIVQSVDGDEKNALLISEDYQRDFTHQLDRRIQTYTDEGVGDKTVAVRRHINAGLLVSNFLTAMKYQNVLFIPSYRNNRYSEGLLESYSVVKPNAGIHMAPILNEKFQCDPNIYVAYPEGHTSMYHDLYLEFGVNIIESNGMYSMGDEDYSITVPEGVKFDCVYLAGHETNETFNAADIKADFAPYCTEDFDLVDHYASHNDQLQLLRDQPFTNESVRLLGERNTTNTVISAYDFVAHNTIRKDNYSYNINARHIQRLQDILYLIMKVY